MNIISIGNLIVNPHDFNNVCYIVAGGPSLKGFNWKLLTPDKFVIAINRSYEVLPYAQIVYFTDKDYWQRHKDAMLKHNGQLMRGALNPKNEKMPPEVFMWHLTRPHGYETKPGCLAHGSNSTYAALNMAAAHLKFKRIYLLGVDMKWGVPKDRSTTHWHDGHKRVDPESTFKKMTSAYVGIAPMLTQAGIEVYNANPDSALNTFPKITIEEALRNDPRVPRRQSREAAQESQGRQAGGVVRESRQTPVRMPGPQRSAKQVAQARARRNREVQEARRRAIQARKAQAQKTDPKA